MSVVAPERPSPPKRIGSQTPRVRLVPESTGQNSAPEVFSLAKSVGLNLDQWQYGALVDGLGEDPNGDWAAFEVGLIVPRQNGKGGILEARELGGLFLFDEKLILHTAHEFKTSQEAFRRLLFWIENTDALRKQVYKVRTSHGEEGIELLNRNRIRFLARSKSSGRGFTGNCLIFDEAMILASHVIAALLPTLSAVRNPQIWYTASAGLIDSTQLQALTLRAAAALKALRAAGGPRELIDPALTYLEWSAAPGTAIDDVDGWYQSNPALGIRIPQIFVERELRAMKKIPKEFLRERMGISDTLATAQVIDPPTWVKARDPHSSFVGRYVLAIDVQPGMRSASIAAAGERPDGDGHFEAVATGEGVGWVVPKLVAIRDKQGRPVTVVLDPSSEAGGLIPEICAAGFEVTEVTARQYAQACVAFVKHIADRSIRHLGQPSMDTALAGARKRKLAESWAWDRKDTATDITPIVAGTLAVWGLHNASNLPPNIW